VTERSQAEQLAGRPAAPYKGWSEASHQYIVAPIPLRSSAIVSLYSAASWFEAGLKLLLAATAMEEQLSPLAVTHLLQHTLRSLCGHDDAQQWVYAVFWRILPRNYPPPKWVLAVRFVGHACDRSACALASWSFNARRRPWRALWLVVRPWPSGWSLNVCWLNCLSAVRQMGSPGRHIRPDKREQEELVRPATSRSCSHKLYYSSSISYGFVCYLYVIIFLGCKSNQIISVQDPGMGGWILQLRSLCLWPRGRSCSCRRRRRIHGRVCCRAGGRQGPAAWALLQDVPRHLQLRWRVRTVLRRSSKTQWLLLARGLTTTSLADHSVITC